MHNDIQKCLTNVRLAIECAKAALKANSNNCVEFRKFVDVRNNFRIWGSDYEVGCLVGRADVTDELTPYEREFCWKHKNYFKGWY